MNIVISGGSKGIGRAIALRFARAGWNVAVYSRSIENLEELKRDILAQNTNSQVLIQAADASRKVDVLAFADMVKEQWNSVEVVVNNAGAFTPDNIIDAPEGKLEEVTQTNLYSAYYLTRALLDRIPNDGTGHIFNLCSIASLKAYPAGSLYTITKHALLGFSRSLRAELRSSQIGVTNVMPGATYTDSWRGSTDLPEDRFMDADEVAEMIYQAYLVMPRTVVEDIVLRPMKGDI